MVTQKAEDASSSALAAAAANSAFAASPTSRAKRVKASQSKTHNMEDLWKKIFFVGTEFDQLDTIYQYNWSFSNLEDAFDKEGKLFGKKVYLFGCIEAISDPSRGGQVIPVPAVVAVVSPFPPSDKIGIASVKDVVSLKQMKMDWFPYIPLEMRDKQIERMKCQIYTLSCTQRRAALEQLRLDRLMEYQYCLPYIYRPLQEDKLHENTVVDIFFPAEPSPVYCEFDWELDELEEFTDDRIKKEELSEDQKDAFKDFVKEEIRKAKKANREARDARKREVEEMSKETRAVFENIKFYKFYPVQTPDTPDLSNYKSNPYINRFYGMAHEIDAGASNDELPSRPKRKSEHELSSRPKRKSKALSYFKDYV